MFIWLLPLLSTVLSLTVKKVRLVGISGQFKIKFPKNKCQVFPLNSHRAEDIFHVAIFKFDSQNENELLL